jgi:hypothetical protein
MAVRNRLLLCLPLCVAACSSSPASSVATDAGADAPAANDAQSPGSDAQPPGNDGAPADAAGDAPADAAGDATAPALEGAASFYELAGGGQKTLALALSFRAPAAHDYDDRSGALGCTADHYDATSKPVPHDANAGLFRVSGFTGGTTLASAVAANPIDCVPGGAYYACTYPAGASAFDAAFSPTASPLGPGPIAFAGNGGPDFAAVYVAGPPDDGTLAVAETLTTIHYGTAQDTVLHPTCSTACPTSRVAVELTAFAASSAASGWPYPSVGVVRCVFASASAVTVPHAAVAAALASDARLDSITTAVVRLPQAPLVTHDNAGNPLTANVGRGVTGTAPR